MIRSGVAALALLAAMSGCKVQEARMQLPGHVAQQTQAVELRGMGGGTSGTFRLGSATGRFTRSAERLGIFDPLYVKRSGGGSFNVSGPEFGGELSGECRFRESEVTVGPIAGKPKTLAYRCDFRRAGAPVAAEFELVESRDSLGAKLSKRERRGWLYLEGQRIGIRSVHAVEGSPIRMATPIGYSFDADGRDIGAIDVNGPDKTVHVPTDPDLRRAVLVASLAIAIFWDPAEVSPGE